MANHRVFRTFIALALLVAGWAVSFHSHRREEAGARETCAVCVAGHQLKSGVGAALDKAEAPLFTLLEALHFVPQVPETLALRPHSSRAPPAA